MFWCCNCSGKVISTASAALMWQQSCSTRMWVTKPIFDCACCALQVRTLWILTPIKAGIDQPPISAKQRRLLRHRCGEMHFIQTICKVICDSLNKSHSTQVLSQKMMTLSKSFEFCAMIHVDCRHVFTFVQNLDQLHAKSFGIAIALFYETKRQTQIWKADCQ